MSLLKMSDSAIAKKIGKNRRTIVNYKNSGLPPSEVIEKISDVTDHSVLWFYGITDQPEKYTQFDYIREKLVSYEFEKQQIIIEEIEKIFYWADKDELFKKEKLEQLKRKSAAYLYRIT